jgi:hypothetical protein
MLFFAMFSASGFVMLAMFRAVMRLGVGVVRAMLCANFIFFAWVFGAMFGAIMFRQGFVLAMLDTGFAFFSFMFGAMLNAIVFGFSQVMVITVFRLCGSNGFAFGRYGRGRRRGRLGSWSNGGFGGGFYRGVGSFATGKYQQQR